MTGEKHRSRYRKTRKGRGFRGVSLHEQSAEESVSEESEIAVSSQGTSHKTQHEISDSDNEVEQPVSASKKKMKLHNSEDEISEEQTQELDEDNYRLVHLKNLSSVLSSIHR